MVAKGSRPNGPSTAINMTGDSKCINAIEWEVLPAPPNDN
jgi:hypothetical protein